MGKNADNATYRLVPGGSFAIFLTMLCLIASCSNAQNAPARLSTEKRGDTPGKKVLLVYLSRTNNTKAIAEIIQQWVGGKLVSLQLEEPYPENYQAIVDQVAKENSSGYLPPLKTKIDSIQQYDLIFIGFPTWGMQLPPPIKTFLHNYDLKGKTIIPFNTNAGYGLGSTLQTIKTLAPSSKILEAFSTQGGKERDGIYLVIKGEKENQAKLEIRNWLQKIGVIGPN